WLLAALSASENEQHAVQLAIEHAAAAVEGEVGAFVREGRVVGAIGFARGTLPEEELVRVAAAGSGTLEVPGAGICRTLAAALVAGDPATSLLVARAGAAPFSSEDASILHGMARVLSLT